MRESLKKHQTFGERRSRKRGAPFLDFDLCSTTPVPNQVFDELLPALGEPELKVLLYIVRQTLGCDRPETPISLDPFPGGTTTSNGHLEKARGILDIGLLTEGLRSLLQKGLVQARKGPPGVDGNPIMLYSLRFKADRPGSGPEAPAAGPSATERVTSYSMKSQRGAPGEAIEADQEENVTRVVRSLIEFGLSSEAARHLGSRFPAPYILEKLSQVRAMVEAGSPLVNRNPQGYLRRAIEEDYTSPERFGATEVGGGPSANPRNPDSEKRRLPTTPRAPTAVPIEQLNQIWQRALAFLQSHVSRANFQVWLEETVLLELEEGQALVGSPTALQRDWLQERMGSLVRRALAEVVGRDVEIAFIVVDSGGDIDEAA